MRSRFHETRNGFTLVELLVVVSIVVLLTALSIPSLIRMGAFTSNHTGNAARELYEALRAARVYASTNNVETAIVYRTKLVFEPANDDFDGTDMVPIIDGYAICRRLSEDEIEQINTDFFDPGTPVGLNEAVFVQIGDGTTFRTMPDNTCILPDVFEVDTAVSDLISVRGLSPVFMIDPYATVGANNESGYLLPFVHPEDTNLTDAGDNDADGEIDERDEASRVHFQQSDGSSRTTLDGPTPTVLTLLNPVGGLAAMQAFPAHRFAPSGEIIPIQDVQRFEMRIGKVPSTIPSDRFVTYEDDGTFAIEYDPAADPTDVEEIDIQFHSANLADAAADTEIAPLFHDPRREPTVGMNLFNLERYMENTTTLLVYTATGRVKIESTQTDET